MDTGRTFNLAAVLLVASALGAGCERREQAWSTGDRPVRFCTDSAGVRVPDAQCAPRTAHAGASPFLWYYLGTLGARSRQAVPPIGGRAFGGGFAPLAGVRYGSPAGLGGGRFGGATGVSRGGFGGIGAGLSAGS